MSRMKNAVRTQVAKAAYELMNDYPEVPTSSVARVLGISTTSLKNAFGFAELEIPEREGRESFGQLLESTIVTDPETFDTLKARLQGLQAALEEPEQPEVSEEDEDEYDSDDDDGEWS